MVSNTNWIEGLQESDEGRRLIERERVCFEATENLSRAMEATKTSKADLARLLGTSKSWVTQLLSGTRNLTLGTLSDAFHVLGRSMHVTYGLPTDSVQVVDDDLCALEFGKPEWGDARCRMNYSWNDSSGPAETPSGGDVFAA